jgi:hypothetical protein
MDFAQNISEPMVRVNFIKFTRGDKGVELSRALSAVMGAGEEVIFSTESDGTDLALNWIVIDLIAAII